MKAYTIFLALSFVSFFASANTERPASDELSGAWDYTVDTPEGVYKGQFIFTKTDEGYAGKMMTQDGETELKDLKIEGNNVTFSLFTQGYLVKVKGAVQGDQFNGKVEVEYEFYTLKARKATADLLAGAWNYTATTPEGVYKGQFVFTKTDDGYTGKMVLQENETKLNNVVFDNDQLSFSLMSQGYDIKVKAKISGKILDGKGEVEYEYFPVKAEKVE